MSKLLKILEKAAKAQALMKEAGELAVGLSDGLGPDDALAIAKALGRVRRQSRDTHRMAAPSRPIFDDD